MCIYYRKMDIGTVIVGIHVDNILAIASIVAANDKFKQEMASVWTIADLGKPKHILGIAVNWDQEGHWIHLSQTTLIDWLIQQFGQLNATPVVTPIETGTKL